VQAAIDRCDFPWDRLLSGLAEQTGRQTIPVSWADLRSFGALGLAYYDGRIVLEQGMALADPELAKAVFLAEGSHMTDFFYLVDGQREAMWDAYHPGLGEDIGGHDHHWFDPTTYYSQIGETYMIGFVNAFAPTFDVSAWGFSHQTTPEIAALLRVIVLGEEQMVFNDIAGHWAQAEIERAAALDFVAGYPDGSFRPNQSVTRAEAVVFLMRVYDALATAPTASLESVIGAHILERSKVLGR